MTRVAAALLLSAMVFALSACSAPATPESRFAEDVKVAASAEGVNLSKVPDFVALGKSACDLAETVADQKSILGITTKREQIDAAAALGSVADPNGYNRMHVVVTAALADLCPKVALPASK
ncbi:hypothetical protein [Microbacterium panaciterrae]|uniref:hypothetical protein n=1 Tax=Microbacterium panaciterrae TaxID=985759 RepID=UPI0031E5B303